jgi:hypothetical protein
MSKSKEVTELDIDNLPVRIDTTAKHFANALWALEQCARTCFSEDVKEEMKKAHEQISEAGQINFNAIKIKD